MKVLFDTSVLVAAIVEAHLRHSEAAPWLARAKAGEIEFLVASHSLAELYSVLSTLPARPRISPADAWRLIQENVVAAAHLIALSPADYFKTGSVGKVVGDRNGTAVLWQNPTVDNNWVTLIPPIPSGLIGSSALGINDDDVAVGSTYWPSDNSAPPSAFKWNAMTGYTLLSPNAQSSTVHFSTASGISSLSDHIVGWIQELSQANTHAESWNGTTSGTRIFSDSVLATTLWDGAISNKANAVNNSDEIVGYCHADPGIPPGGPHAFVSVGSSIIDLNTYLTSGWQGLVEAKDINDYTSDDLVGQIVGYGTTSSGATHAFLFTP